MNIKYKSDLIEHMTTTLENILLNLSSDFEIVDVIEMDRFKFKLEALLDNFKISKLHHTSMDISISENSDDFEKLIIKIKFHCKSKLTFMHYMTIGKIRCLNSEVS